MNRTQTQRMESEGHLPVTSHPLSTFERQTQAESEFRGLVNPPPIPVRSHAVFPTHLICYYKETTEVHQSMDAFGPEFDPVLVVVCENVKDSGTLGVLSYYFQGSTPTVGLNIGTHRISRAPFLLYVKSEQEPRGKRFSHRLGADIVRAMHHGNIDNVHVLFQDADTASNPTTLLKMVDEAVIHDIDMVGATMTSFNSFPWTVTGAYTSFCELLAVSDRLLETGLFRKTRIISGSYVLLRLSTYYTFSDRLCRPAADMTLLERVSYATEDTLLSHMLSCSGHSSKLVLDEVAWNLPQTFTELLKQRRRWMNGEIATFLTSSRFVERGVGSSLFYLWTVLYFVKSWFINNSFNAILLLMYFIHGYTLLALPALLTVALKAFVMARFFRRSCDDSEGLLGGLAHLYCMCNLASIGAAVFYFWGTPWFAFFMVGVPFVQGMTLMAGSAQRKLYVSISSVVYFFYARGISNFLHDYAIANLSDTSWGVRETKRDLDVYGNQADASAERKAGRTAERSAGRSDLLTHAWVLLLLQVFIPVSMAWLVIAVPSGLSTFLTIALVDAILYNALLVLRALSKHHLLDPFLAEPAFNVKSRLVYPVEMQVAFSAPTSGVLSSEAHGASSKNTAIWNSQDADTSRLIQSATQANIMTAPAYKSPRTLREKSHEETGSNEHTHSAPAQLGTDFASASGFAFGGRARARFTTT